MAVLSTSGAQQVVPAQEILAKLANKEPVYYDSVQVLGDLDLKSLPDARVSNSFALTNSILINASFDGVTFEKDAVFWGTTFANASFTAASFAQPAVFDGALFRDNVSFEDARFGMDAFFNEARFLANANFNYSNFDSYSYFSSAQFLGDALFSDIDFSGTSDFSAASFIGKANFFQSRFQSPIFSDAVFSGPVQFGLAQKAGFIETDIAESRAPEDGVLREGDAIEAGIDEGRVSNCERV